MVIRIEIDRRRLATFYIDWSSSSDGGIDAQEIQFADQGSDSRTMVRIGKILRAFTARLRQAK